MEMNINPRKEFLMCLLKGTNNLVVTTTCNINCCFCSRKFNPFPTKSYHRDFNELVEEIKMLIPDVMKGINSSISRMTDGEPFTHPRIWDILKLLREIHPYKKMPRMNDKIKITTNGTYLTEDNLKKLEELKGMIIIHSINSSNIEDWMKLSGSTKQLAEVATNVPRLIKNFDIEYAASVVAMPKIVGYDGIERTIRDLHKHNVKSIRVFLPTYTKYASKEEKEMLYCDVNKLKDLVDRLREELQVTIWLYPFTHDDLTPRLYGFENFGISPKDEILSINKEKMFSRDHAFTVFLYSIGTIKIMIKTEDGKIKEIDLDTSKISWKNPVDSRMNYDISFTVKSIEEKTKNYQKILVAHSKAGEKIVKLAFKKAIEWSDELKKKEFYFQTVYNDFYGGSVQSAGLLLCQDYKKYIQKFIDENFRPDIVLMSRDSFDLEGKDLLYESIYDVCKKLGIIFELI